MKMMNQKKRRQANQGKKNWKKQASEKESTDHDETEKKKRRRERQSNSSRKSNLLFKNSIKALLDISHCLMQNYPIVTMSISLSVSMRLLQTANMKRVCTYSLGQKCNT